MCISFKIADKLNSNKTYIKYIIGWLTFYAKRTSFVLVNGWFSSLDYLFKFEAELSGIHIWWQEHPFIFW